MLIGIDLDNTIINYQNSLKIIAKSRNIKIIRKFTKDYVRKKIEKVSKKDWTIIQGEIYGKNILEANLFDGFKKFLDFSKKNEIKLIIISHKTKYPIVGEKKNLHLSAIEFIEKKIGKNIFVINKNLFFEKNIDNKINRIKKNDCDYFIDDLSKILINKSFPETTEGLLFNGKNKVLKGFKNWNQIIDYFKNQIRKNKSFEGKNNNCFAIKNKSILIKQFNNTKTKNNFQKELKFSKFLQNNKINQVPKIISYSNKRKVIKYQFINKIKNKRFDVKHIKQNFRFIEKINKLDYVKENFDYAKDFCKNYNDYYKEIYDRISKLKKNIYYKKNYLFRELIDNINLKFLKLKNINYFDNSFILKKKDLILSPCDFHVKNMIISKKIYYYDFEYSGLDDPAKLYSVFFLQPEFLLSKKVFLNNLSKILFFKRNKNLIKKRIIYLLPIMYLRWSLIILNAFNKAELNKNKFIYDKEKKNKNLIIQISKASLYLKNRNDYFNLDQFSN
jgi:hypothetical protein